MAAGKNLELAGFEFKHHRPRDASFAAGGFPDFFCKAADHWLCFCNWNIVFESVFGRNGFRRPVWDNFAVINSAGEFMKASAKTTKLLFQLRQLQASQVSDCFDF